MRKKLLLLSLLIVPTIGWSKYVALLTETAPGGNINSQKDIVTMKRILGNRYEFIVINSPQSTSVKIRNRLKALAKTLKEEDTFLFYYSGHGNRFYTGDEDEADHHDDFLLTSDYKCSGGSDVTNVLTDDELNFLYSKIKARKIIIIDACHSSSMNKSSLDFSNVKQFKGCSGGLTTKGFTIDPSYRKAHNSNFLHFGAASENLSAIGSRDGGLFTLALEKIIKEKGNISFAKLETYLQGELTFEPSISDDSTIDKNSLYTKDIFVVTSRKPPKPQSQTVANNLSSLLKEKPKTIKLVTHSGEKSFPIHKSVPILGYFNKSSKQHIYLLELKGKNSFTLIASKPRCLSYSKYGYNYRCGFDLKATEPTGRSNIYMLKTSKPLDTGSSKSSVITEDFFDAKRSLFEQLNDMHFEVGKIDVKTY